MDPSGFATMADGIGRNKALSPSPGSVAVPVSSGKLLCEILYLYGCDIPIATPSLVVFG